MMVNAMPQNNQVYRSRQAYIAGQLAYLEGRSPFAIESHEYDEMGLGEVWSAGFIRAMQEEEANTKDPATWLKVWLEGNS